MSSVKAFMLGDDEMLTAFAAFGQTNDMPDMIVGPDGALCVLTIQNRKMSVLLFSES